MSEILLQHESGSSAIEAYSIVEKTENGFYASLVRDGGKIFFAYADGWSVVEPLPEPLPEPELEQGNIVAFSYKDDDGKPAVAVYRNGCWWVTGFDFGFDWNRLVQAFVITKFDYLVRKGDK